MLASLKRLSLGLLLIVGASALLLMSDQRSRVKPAASAVPAPKPERIVRIALLQHASQMVLDQGREGMLAALAEKGWVQDRNLQLKYYNAQGDMTVAQAIAKEMAGGGYDLLLTISTVSMQAVANANKEGRTPHVFGLVSDPYGAGVGISRENHLDHPAHLAGYGTMQPIALAFKTAREMNPDLKIVGVVWNAAEANSEAQVKLARKICADLDITLLESTVDNSAGVAEAAGALVARGIEALWAGGDVTVMAAIDSVIAAGRKGHVPVFTVIPPNAKRGALFDIGADYDEVGRLTGLLAAEILDGRSPATVSIENVMPEVLVINQQALAGLRQPWKVSAAHLARAQLVIDEQGVEHAKAPAHPAGPAAAASAPPLRAVAGRAYQLGFAAFSPEPSLESCQRGLLEGLKEFGFVEGGNLTVRRTHAQGEMVNIPQMIQNMDATEVDAMVTFSTPVLQTAMSMAKRKPVVFTYVTDPLAAGAGKSYEDHLPNLTGIGSLPPIDDTIQIIRRTLPQVKTIGTIYNNSEANSVKIITLLRESTKRANLGLVELTAANSNEVLLAMQALATRGIDAFYMVSDNTAYLAYDAILKVADSAKLPVIIDDPDYLDQGALFACGPGYFHSGKAAAPLLARVLLGESPAKIPMANVSVNTTKFNPAVIAKLGLTIDPAVIREIEQAGTTKVAAAPGPVAPAANPAPAPAANPTGKKWKIAYVLYNETPPAEQLLEGMKERWARSPLVAGRDYEITTRSAQGDMSSLGGLIDAAVTEGADLIVPMSTPALQVAVQKVKRTPVLFSLIANPMAAGAGRSYTDHLPNVSGIAVLAPFNEALDRLAKYFPNYKRLGTLYCPAEANSVDLKQSLEAACRARGFTLEVVAANTASELPDAAISLMARPIDCVLQLSDNLTSGGFTAITRAARQARMPLFSLNTTTVALGSAWALGRDYHDAGEATVAMLERLIRGEAIAQMPFELPPRVAMKASEENAHLLGFTLPPALLAEVAASRGKPAPATPPPAPAKSSTAPVAPVKKWKIATILYNETPPAEETLAGMQDAWRRSSFVEGRDYEVKLRSAQGDMGLLSGIVDAALTDGADLVVTLSTSTLQIAATKAKRVPVVFTLVTNPMAAGAGRSYTDHLPNVTGIAVLAPVGEALDLLRRHYPSFKRIGTLYCPAEANAVYLKDALDEACRQRGFTLETVAANTATDLPDAALALMSRPIDVVLQIPDALSSAGFSALTRAARQRQMPLMALNSTVVAQGAALGFGRDFHNAGEATVALIERIFRGEKPADIPFALPPKISAVASLGNARALGLTLPPALLKEMGKVTD